MSARQDVADALEAALPYARVLPYAKGLDNLPPGQNVLMVYRSQVTPSIVQGARVDELAVWCVVPNVDPGKVDDLLDDLLDDVLDVLADKPFQALAWSAAERDVLFDSWPAYKITATIQTRKD